MRAQQPLSPTSQGSAGPPGPNGAAGKLPRGAGASGYGERDSDRGSFQRDFRDRRDSGEFAGSRYRERGFSRDNRREDQPRGGYHFRDGVDSKVDSRPRSGFPEPSAGESDQRRLSSSRLPEAEPSLTSPPDNRRDSPETGTERTVFDFLYDAENAENGGSTDYSSQTAASKPPPKSTPREPLSDDSARRASGFNSADFEVDDRTVRRSQYDFPPNERLRDSRSRDRSDSRLDERFDRKFPSDRLPSDRISQPLGREDSFQSSRFSYYGRDGHPDESVRDERFRGDREARFDRGPAPPDFYSSKGHGGSDVHRQPSGSYRRFDFSPRFESPPRSSFRDSEFSRVERDFDQYSRYREEDIPRSSLYERDRVYPRDDVRDFRRDPPRRPREVDYVDRGFGSAVPDRHFERSRSLSPRDSRYAADAGFAGARRSREEFSSFRDAPYTNGPRPQRHGRPYESAQSTTYPMGTKRSPSRSLSPQPDRKRVAGNDRPLNRSRPLEEGCFCCGSFDHSVKECPQSHQTCFICQEKGHVQSNCPKNKDIQRCYRCGDPTHIAMKCRHRSAKCYVCGDIGHIDRVCSKNPNGLKIERRSRQSRMPPRTDSFSSREGRATAEDADKPYGDWDQNPVTQTASSADDTAANSNRSDDPWKGQGAESTGSSGWDVEDSEQKTTSQE